MSKSCSLLNWDRKTYFCIQSESDEGAEAATSILTGSYRTFMPSFTTGGNAYCTCLIDFYGIDSDFPGKKEAARKSGLSDKQRVVCDAFFDKLAQTLKEGEMRRFIPYVQMHEFEGLLFSDPSQLVSAIRRQDLAQHFWDIRHEFDTPEHIDDSPVNAPSKRIQKVFPRYRKVQMGERAARAITLKKIRQQCPLFNGWLVKLESLQPLSA